MSAAKTKANLRTSYCRFCGENKGHSSSTCTNAAEMRRIIKGHDEQLQNAQFRQEELEAIKVKLSQQEGHLAFMSRLIHSLLDLCEAHRLGNEKVG